MQGELNVVWDKLLPAFNDAALAENAEEQEKLRQVCSSLAIPATHAENVLKLPGS